MSSVLTTSHEAGTGRIPVRKMRKLRLREGTYTAIVAELRHHSRALSHSPRSKQNREDTDPTGMGAGAARLADGSTRSKSGEIRNPKTFH